MTSTTPIEPPAAAVAADPHWAATRARLKARTRPQSVLRICDDTDAKDALATAQYAARRAAEAAEADKTPATRKALSDAEAAVTEAQARVDEASIVLRFQALERAELDALKTEHPPTETQAEEGYEFNIDTLGPELVAASSMDGMTVEDATEYLTTWSDAEANALFTAAWGVQREARMDLGKG